MAKTKQRIESHLDLVEAELRLLAHDGAQVALAAEAALGLALELNALVLAAVDERGGQARAERAEQQLDGAASGVAAAQLLELVRAHDVVLLVRDLVLLLAALAAEEDGAGEALRLQAELGAGAGLGAELDLAGLGVGLA